MTPEARVRGLLLAMGNDDTTPEEYDAGLAALDALVAERDALTARNEFLESRWQEMDHPFDHSEHRAAIERAEAAEARVAALTEALRTIIGRIEDHTEAVADLEPGDPACAAYDIARAALAAADRPEGTTP